SRSQARRRTYTRGTLSVGASSLAMGPAPALTGTTGVGTSGFCYTQVRFNDGKVTQVEFAGDNNTTTSINGLCVSTVDRCVVYAKSRKSAALTCLKAPARNKPRRESIPASGDEGGAGGIQNDGWGGRFQRPQKQAPASHPPLYRRHLCDAADLWPL